MKKKVAAVVLAVLMLIGTMAIAETDQVITFMDIPWETLAGEYVEKVKEVTEYARPDEKWFPPLYAPSNGKFIALDPDMMENIIEEETSVGFYIGMNNRYMQKEQQVAGYPLLSIKGCTVNSVSNGVVVEDKNKSIVVEMSYQLDIEKIADLKIAYDDLKQKLCSLYGECDNIYENAEEGRIICVEKSIWYGENTYVFLHLSRWPNIAMCTLEIVYGRRDVAQLIESVKNPDMVATMSDPNDVSGL